MTLAQVSIPSSIRLRNLANDEPKARLGAEKMRRVFVNLIENAIDAMPQGGELTIQSKESERNQQVAVSATGTGIEENAANRILKPFFNAKVKGVGLGLSISKRIVDAYKGYISFETDAANGATFTVTIRYRRGITTDPAKMLVIDDDASVREVLAMALENAGHVVDTAENGGEAIRKSNANFYNLALIDVRLPDMEGTRLLADMKDTMPKMVKIIVTGYPGLQNAVESVNKGADAYVVKPFKMEGLLKTVGECLKKQEEAKKYSEEKVKEFIETRAKELERRR